MMKNILLLIIALTIIISSSKVLAFDSNLKMGKSVTLNDDIVEINYLSLGHTYTEGEWWDFLVKNRNWTTIDYLIENELLSSFETLLTTPVLKPSYVDDMKINFKFNRDYISNQRIELFVYTTLSNGFKFHTNLLSLYNKSSFNKGYQYECSLNNFNDRVNFDSGYEYSLALFKLSANIKAVKNYKYEIGSWFSKEIRTDIEIIKKKVCLGYAVIPVRIDENYKNASYFFNVSGMKREIE